MIGRAGLAEGQSALTDKGAGDASAAARSRWLAERWRYTRNQNNQGPTSCRVGETMITNEFACLTLLSLSRSRYVHHPHPTFFASRLDPFANCHKLFEDWLMGFQEGKRMMEPSHATGDSRQIRGGI